MPTDPYRPGPQTLSVNWIACQGRGWCIEMLPELISADDWGYPMIAPGPVPPSLEGHARRAVNACPTVALRLQPSPPR
jgi:ferredoxin